MILSGIVGINLILFEMSYLNKRRDLGGLLQMQDEILVQRQHVINDLVAGIP